MLNYKTHGNLGRLWRIYGRSVLRYGTPRKVLNALRTERAYRKRTVDVPTPPYVLFIEPLYYCNLHCPLCPRETQPEARQGEVGKLDLALFDQILDEIGDYLFQCHIFGLGEPLLDWARTQQVIEKAHARRIFTLVSTNCTLVTPRMAEEIVSSNLDYLVCAIDGITQETYGRYRIGGKIEKALEGLRLLAEAKRRTGSRTEIEWQFLVNAHNAHEMEAALRMSQELGVRMRFTPIGGTENDPGLQQEWLPDLPDWQDGRVEPGRSRRGWHCYWLWRGLTINSNGQLARCPGYSNIAQMGSLQEHSIMSLYNGPASQRSRQLFQLGAVSPGEFPEPGNTCSSFEREHGGAAGPMATRDEAVIIPLELSVPK